MYFCLAHFIGSGSKFSIKGRLPQCWLDPDLLGSLPNFPNPTTDELWLTWHFLLRQKLVEGEVLGSKSWVYV